MKAQSDLAGNGKSMAEMAMPRKTRSNNSG